MKKKKECPLQCEGHHSDPWSRKIPRALGQLSPWAPTTEPALQSLRAAPAKV